MNNKNSNGLVRILSFKGRIGQGEYFVTLGCSGLCNIPADWLLNEKIAYTPTLMTVNSIIVIIMGIIITYIIAAQGAKRCHDLGKNGWWQLIPFYFIYMLFAKGKIFANEYGAPPKI